MIFKKFTYIESQKNLVLFDMLAIVIHKLYPQNFNLIKLNQFYTLILGLGLNTRAFRLIFLLPVNGQNTWSPIKSAKQNTNTFLFWKFFFFKKIFKKSNLNLFRAEYFNLMYQSYFSKDFNINKNSLKKVLAIRRNNKFIDTTSLANLSANNIYKNPIFLKKSSKKKKTNNKKRNLGFLFGFTKKYHRHLI